jgi:translation initiation factor eIF-2B subunit alpha
VRLYPLGQYDLPIEQTVIDFKTRDEVENVIGGGETLGGPETDYFNEKTAVTPVERLVPNSAIDAVDFTVSTLVFSITNEIDWSS